MKKVWCFAFLIMLTALYSFAGDTSERTIYIEGTATIPDQRTFFIDNFRMEAVGQGFEVKSNKSDAEYTFQFEVSPYDDTLFLIRVTLILNETNARIVSLSMFFTRLEDMYEHNQYLFYQAIMYIPQPVEVETVVKTVPAPENYDWRNKWLYLRASFNYPITFYRLMDDGLIGGIGIYDGPFDTPTRVSPLDNSIVAMPGGTLGAEVQFLDWMSAEVNFQLSFGRPGFFLFANYALGAELKFPLKFFKSFVIEPYGALAFYLNKSPVYDDFPRFALGGGVQVGVKGGSRGVIFIDVNYMQHLGDVVMYNTYNPLYPDPPVIHYQRFILGLGIGYKFGFFDRKKN